MSNNKEFDMTDIDDIAGEWKEVNWDLVQRMRFMNADQEIAPDDKYTARELNERDTYTRE